ncbi:MAG TPA: hypothetical protein VHO23_01615 [Candidatus Paceibacterota bacterium]|nr:hypothetical protein [Candidatus Paceibacterota bacterium]
MEHPGIDPEGKSEGELLARVRDAVDPRRHDGAGSAIGKLEPAVRLDMLELLARDGHCMRTCAVAVFRTSWLTRDTKSWEAWERFAAEARRKVVIVIVDIGEDMLGALTRARKLVESGAIYVSVLTSQVNLTQEMLGVLVDGMDLRLTDPPIFSTKGHERVKLLIPAPPKAEAA